MIRGWAVLLVAWVLPNVALCAPEPGLGDAEIDAWQSLFQRYLRIDTTNPPGHEARAIPLLSAALEELGLKPRISALDARTATTARANLWAHLAADKPTGGALVLLHHTDVVPVERAKWTRDPFGGEVADGQIWGRGAIDTKILGIYQLAALRYLAARKDRLQRHVVFLAVADEEKGGRGAIAAVERELPGWKAEYLLDEGGFAIDDFIGEQDVLVIATAQKRVAKLELIAHGEAGHGSRPIPGGGPNILVEALHRILSDPPPMRLGPTSSETFAKLATVAGGLQGFLLARLDWPGVLPALSGTLSANQNLNPMLRDTMTLTLLDAGQKANVIPADATATFDVRLLPGTQVEDFMARLETLLEGLPVELKLVEKPLAPYPPSPTEDPLYRALEETLAEHAPDTLVAPWLMVGANDSRFFAPQGVRTYGFNPALLTKSQIDSIHGHNERVGVDAFRAGLRAYVDAVARFALARAPTE